MENLQKVLVGPSPHDDDSESGEDAAYTEGETEFADGQGTQLDEEIDTATPETP